MKSTEKWAIEIFIISNVLKFKARITAFSCQTCFIFIECKTNEFLLSKWQLNLFQSQMDVNSIKIWVYST